MSKRLSQSLMALCAAVIWGTSFVAQSVSTDLMGPCFFMASRSVAACAFLGILILIRKTYRTHDKPYFKKLFLGGTLSGTVLAAASWLQQSGIAYTTAGKAGFLTALYIIIVPILRLFGGKKASAKTWISVILAVAGFALLSLSDDLSVGRGEILVICCAFCFSLQIIIIDRTASDLDSIEFSFVQFLTVVILCGIGSFFFESTPLSAIRSGIIPLLYSGILSGGVAYTLQVAAQKDCDEPVRISILLSLESVFSAISGALLLKEMMRFRELIGCVIIFSAAILAQLSEKSNNNAIMKAQDGDLT